MAAKFDTAIPELISVTEGFQGFTDMKRACVVRDLLGRVRLVVDAPDTLDVGGLTDALEAGLGGWFQGPVLNTSAGSASERGLARTILERATEWPVGWPKTRTDPTGKSIDIEKPWSGYRRVLSKQAWLDSAMGSGAWPLVVGNPAIVAFFSFKGGVGRSTLLGAIAWQLARAGKKVVCLDLDLEAPGLGGLLDVTAEESLIDHLLTHGATGQMPVEDPVTWATVHGVQIGVVPAGQMNRGYIDKLARLDYLGASSATESPVAKALDVLLKRIKGQHRPDYLLLDCRAGLHDLGGLSLTDVAHVDVLVGRDTPQGREGLALILDVLSTRRRLEDQRIQLVQTFVPLPMGGEHAELTRKRFRTAMYEACSPTLYAHLKDAEMPAEDDDGVAHFPWAIGQYDEIAASERLGDISPEMLGNTAFTASRQRIEAIAAPEGASDREETNDGDE